MRTTNADYMPLIESIIDALVDIQRKIAVKLFRHGFRAGFSLLYNEMMYTEPFIRERTSPRISFLIMEVVLEAAWLKRREFERINQIQGYTMRFAVVLTEMEIDRRKDFSHRLTLAWNERHAIRTDTNNEEIPDFISLVVQRYTIKDIAEAVEISYEFCIALLLESFSQVRLTFVEDDECTALWDNLSDKIIRLSSEQAS